MTTQRRITAGAIQDLALAEIIQMISLGRKTARLLVNSPDGSGKIWFDDGHAVHASQCGLRGTEAFYKLLEWESGQFVIEHEVTCRTRSINEDTMFMVMESLRRRDESNEQRSPRNGNPKTGGTDPGSAGQRIFGAAMATAVVFVVVTLGLLVDSIDPRQLVESGTQVNSAELRGNVAASSPEPTDPFGFCEAHERVKTDARPEPAAQDQASNPNETRVTEPEPPIKVTAEVASTPGKPLAVLYDPLAISCAPTVVAEPAVEPAFLHLRAHSKVRRGTLLVVANEQEVFRHELALRTGGLKRIFSRFTGSAGENFEQRIPLPSGHQRLVARLIRPNKKDREMAIEFDLDPGDVRPLGLVVGIGSANPLIWKDETLPRVANGTERRR
jgi:hypothetical protein